MAPFFDFFDDLGREGVKIIPIAAGHDAALAGNGFICPPGSTSA